MAHDEVYGFCENKCKVEVPSKAEYDADMGKLDKITIDASGNIVGNIKGNVVGNVTGNVTGFLFVKGTVGTSGDVNYATCAAQSVTINTKDKNSPVSIKPANYAISFGNPQKHTWGVYTRRADLAGTTNPSLSTRTIKINVYGATNSTGHYSTRTVYYKKSTDTSWSSKTIQYKGITISSGVLYETNFTINATVGSTYQFYLSDVTEYVTIKAEIDAGTTYKVKYATP